MWPTLLESFELVLYFDQQVWEIVGVSLQVSLTALVIGTVIGLPLGGILATNDFVGRKWLITILNSLMNVPTVIIGVLIYLLLSRSGPLGSLGLLFSTTGMIIAQSLITIPLIAAISRQIIADGWAVHGETLKTLHLSNHSQIKWILWDCRFSLLLAVLAGFGRAISEVGTVMIVGGNIANSTRTLTTAISLETSKGDLPFALALGIVLISIVLIINLLASVMKHITEKNYG